MSQTRTAQASDCPNATQHTPDQPTGYLAWQEWAERMSKKHRQKRCPSCGRYQIWVPKRRAESGEDPL